MNTINKHLRTPAVTYALITQKTETGFKMHTFCLMRSQYKKMRRAGIVIVKNIGKSNFMELTKKA